MSKSKKNRIKDLAACWFYGICIVLVFWMISSTLEVWYHNAQYWAGKNYTYSIYNFYNIMMYIVG